MPIDPIGHTDIGPAHVDAKKAGHTDTITAPHVDTPPKHSDACQRSYILTLGLRT
jgi:hypothetical protein